ncbi:MAG TPA: NAD(P)/FAD-dependent oxidoreductase [Solirubrobacteraceae bacterium]|nr:NAD(P)/FAD-dependent oxidoreductase [Solirubrobacteraceae bacterium]
MSSYDVIVIGARCAGATTAMLLARAGLDVLLVDRAELPSEIPHGHFIHRHGPPRLAKWGLLEPIVSTNCPPVTSMTTDFGDFPLAGRDLVADGVPLGIAPRRAALDGVLLNAAVNAGVELRDRFAVDDYTSDGERITGIAGRDARSGSRATEHATVVVGADGRNSGLARRVEAPVHESAPTATCWYFSYYGGVPCDGLELYGRPGRVIFAFQTNDDLVGLFVGFPTAELPVVRADIEGRVLATVDAIPELGQRIRAGRRAERFYGATQLPNFLRKPWGAGWALVGDAGCHKDPCMALGICDALRDAELLAEALTDGLSGRRRLADALADYERRRDAATRPDFKTNLAMAQLGPVPDRERSLRAALRFDQEATNHFFLAIQGMVSPDSFFNDENIARIFLAARASAA